MRSLAQPLWRLVLRHSGATIGAARARSSRVCSAEPVMLPCMQACNSQSKSFSLVAVEAYEQ